MKNDEFIDIWIKTQKEQYQDQLNYIKSSGLRLYEEHDKLIQTKKSIPKWNLIKKYTINKKRSDNEKEIKFLAQRLKLTITFDNLLSDTLRTFKEIQSK